MKDIINRPRISRWIFGGYLILVLFIAALYAAIAVWSDVLSFPIGGLIFSASFAFVLIVIGTITYSLYSTTYAIKDGYLYSWSPFAVVNLRVKDIAKIERTRTPLYFRGFGASLYCGRFYIPAFGWTRVIMTNVTDCVLITAKSGKRYLITPSNPEGFIKSLRG